MFLKKLNSLVILSFSFFHLLKTRLDFIFLNFNHLIKPVKLKKSSWTKSDMRKFCRFVEKLSKIIGVKSCFIKSVTKRNFLLNKGYKCEMYIGVTLKDKFKSHSWLVSEEINCFESPDKNMKVLKVVK
ncbi:MAG: hypothetical protein CMQ70_01260 [Gammaproteobacteria bacterium]|nr:hypothetical protein [Gammaproteobacteria bacterium]|tara:strand:- start:3429 stop:3812 length:384 start_codon:yes stop_codon:yes gene_type:complete